MPSAERGDVAVVWDDSGAWVQGRDATTGEPVSIAVDDDTLRWLITVAAPAAFAAHRRTSLGGSVA